MTEPSIRVLLVDDQELVRAGFRTIMSIDARIDVVGEAGTGVEAVAAARELNPDVICLDVQMPDMDGIEATRIITADPSVTSAVLILTTFNRDDYLFSALAAGASGFMLKNSSPEQLIAAIVSVASGDALLSPQVTRSVIERFAQTEAGAATDGGDSDGGGLAGTVLAGTVHAGTVLAGEAVAQPEPTSAIPEPDDARTFSSRSVNLRCSNSWRRGFPTSKSPASCLSARRRSRPTCRTCCASSACATASRPSSTHTSTAYSSPREPLVGRKSARGARINAPHEANCTHELG